MISIRHNFDRSQFMWLWAKYVKAGNIDKHCTACLIGPYSKNFPLSAKTSKSMQNVCMDEVLPTNFEAIYFCGVLKRGYLNKNPLKNNYPHNVHFAIVPKDGARDEWKFENWRVEIEGGILERIPETYEIPRKFFITPYTPHYYTCRIFRWMVGHFYPQELIDTTYGFPEKIYDESQDCEENLFELFSKIRQNGYDYAKLYFEDELYYFDNLLEEMSIDNDQQVRYKNSRDYVLSKGLFDRKVFAETISDWATSGGADYMECGHLIKWRNKDITIDFMYLEELLLWPLFKIGIEDYLDFVDTNHQRTFYSIITLPDYISNHDMIEKSFWKK